MAVEVVNVAMDLKPVMGIQGAGSIRGPVTTIIRSSGTNRLTAGKAAVTRRSKSVPTPEPPTVTTQTFSSAR